MLRLLAEARDALNREEDVSLPWRCLCLPSTDWLHAALALWQKRPFQDLLKKEGLHVRHDLTTLWVSQFRFGAAGLGRTLLHGVAGWCCCRSHVDSPTK